MTCTAITLGPATAALAQARGLGASGAKVGVAQNETLTVNFEAGRLKDTGGSESCSLCVDALVGGRRGQATCGQVDTLPRAVAQAVGLARLGSVAHFVDWPAPACGTRVPARAASTAALTREQLIDACRCMSDLLKAYDPDLFIGCSARRWEGESLLDTSGGVEHARQTNGWSLGLQIQRTQGTDLLLAYAGRSWGELNAYFDPQAMVDEMLFQLRHAERIVLAPTGPVTVLLTPETLAMFLWPVLMGLNGRTVAKGASPLAGKIGQRILSPAFTIADDPHEPYGRSTAEVDYDGVPTRRQALIDAGVLQRFLYDLDSAGLAGAAPTGNNGCAPYFPRVTPGDHPSATLLAGIRDGLYLTPNLIGYGQSNIINGDVSCNVGLGYRIADGEIVGRVKDVMIACNIYDVLCGNVVVSADTDYCGATPYAVVEGVTVSAKR